MKQNKSTKVDLKNETPADAKPVLQEALVYLKETESPRKNPFADDSGLSS